MRLGVLVMAAATAVGCASSNQQQGTFAIGAGETTFTSTSETDVERFVEEPPVNGGPGPGDLRFKKQVCEGIDLRPAEGYLSLNDLTTFLDSRAIPYEKRALRPNLVLLKLQTKTVKDLELRVAILDSAAAAGNELEDALLEHGQGSWGLHRSNLSVLGPIGSFDDIIGVTATTGLACWGTVLLAGRDDAFALGGGYIEF